MIKLILLASLINVLSLNIYSQTKKEIRKEQERNHERMLDTIKRKLAGVKYANLDFQNVQEAIAVHNLSSGDAPILSGIQYYLKKILGLTVLVTSEQKKQEKKLSASLCDVVRVKFKLGEFNSRIMAVGNYPFYFEFKFCDNSSYSFDTKLAVNGMTDYLNLIKSICQYHFPVIRKYNTEYTLKIGNNETIISLADFNKYLDSSTAKKQREGLYQLFNSNESSTNHLLGVYNHNDTLKIIYFEGADFDKDWHDGELKGTLISTKSENDFFGKWYILDKSLIDITVSVLNENSFELRPASGEHQGIDKYIRLK